MMEQKNNTCCNNNDNSNYSRINYSAKMHKQYFTYS